MNTKHLIYLLFFLALGFLTFSCYENRIYDWDMPGYLGSIFSWDYPNNPKLVHDLVYSSIKLEASAEEFDNITSYNAANKVFTANYLAFSEQLPYYEIKVGYNLAVYLLYKIGFTGPHAVLMINVLSYFAAGILLLYITGFIFPKVPVLSSLLSLFILWMPPVSSMAQNPTPDMFLLVFMLLFVISVLQNRSHNLRFIFLLCCVIIRPDYILFALSYLAAAFVYDYFKVKNNEFRLIVHAFILVLVYIGIIQFFDYPGWKDVFYDTFIYRRPIISAEEAVFTFKDYIDIIFFRLINFKKVTLISLVLLGGTFYLSRDLWIRILSVVFFANIYFKFLLFPQGATLRFFIGYIILLAVVFLYAAGRKYGRTKIREIV